MVLISTLKDSLQSSLIEYKLRTGEVLTYLFEPHKSITTAISEMVGRYCNLSFSEPHQVYVRPWVFAQLNNEYAQSRVNFNQPLVGWTTLRMYVPTGVVEVIPQPDLKWPIFIGTMEDYESNDFDEAMEKLLVEESKEES